MNSLWTKSETPSIQYAIQSKCAQQNHLSENASISLTACFFPSLPASINSTLPSNLVKFNIWLCFVTELSSENLRTCFQIVNAYIYLSATEFLQVRGTHTNACTQTHTCRDLKSHTFVNFLFIWLFSFCRTLQNHCVAPSVICSKTSRMRDKSKCSRYHHPLLLQR